MSQSQSDDEPLFSSPRVEQKSPLLTILPLEIREQIYSEILPPQSTLYPDVRTLFQKAEDHESGKRKFRSHETVLTLARTCQAFYAELIPFYYKTKTLSFYTAYDLYRYLYMIGLDRRKLVQRVDFWLKGVSMWCDSMTTKTQEIYEWMCGLLRECVSLRRIGIAVSVETKHGMESGPIKGLEALRGMGLKGLEIRVREMWAWPFQSSFGGELQSVWEVSLVPDPRAFQDYRHFMPEVVSALEKRLLQDMTAVGDVEGDLDIGIEFHNAVDDTKSDFRKGKGKLKRKVSTATIGGRNKGAKKGGTSAKGKRK